MEECFKNTKTVLIVDDFPANLEMLSSLLNDYGFKTPIAKSGKTALSRVEKMMPDLILLDIFMPEMDGYEVCKKLKSNPKTKDIPVIFLTSSNEVFDKIKTFQIGAADYISKPFHVEEVLARINSQLKIKDAQSRLIDQNVFLNKTLDKLKITTNKLIFSEKNNAYGKLIVDIASKINQPLGKCVTMSSYLQMQTDEIKDKIDKNNLKKNELVSSVNKMKKFSNLIADNIQDVICVVNKMLDITGYSKDTRNDKFSLKNIVHDVVSYNSSLLSKHNIVTTTNEDDIEVRGDMEIFFLVINNIVQNSIMHAFKHKLDKKITIDYKLKTDTLYLTIEDNGDGVDEITLREITEPFYTTFNDSKSHGLGLFNVYNLVTQVENGSINFTSDIDKGFKVDMFFPQ